MTTTILTSIKAVREYAGITETSEDKLLDRLILAASGYVEQWCSRTFAVTNYTEIYSGNNSRKLVLRQLPVISVSSLKLDGATIPARTSLVGNGYVFDDMTITLVGYRFTEGVQNIEVAYSAGFAAVPADLEQAVIEMVVQRYKDRNRIGLNSHNLGGEQAVFDTNSLSKFARSTLQQYKRVTPT